MMETLTVQYPRLEIEDGGDRLTVVSILTMDMFRIRVANGVDKEGPAAGSVADILLDREEVRQLFNWLGVQLHKYR